MAITWVQEKAALQEIIKEHYADTLCNAGFVSYKSEGFHWYRLKNDLLQKVHLWTYSPRMPVMLLVGYGAVPLFSWEPIAPSRPVRDWPLELTNEHDHFLLTWYKDYAEQLIGKLPREWYNRPNILYHLPNDVFIGHLHTDHCGAEVLDEMVLPMLEALKTPQEVYRFNLERRLLHNECQTEEELNEKMLQSAELGRNMFLTLTFDDECLFFRDEKLYPAVYRHVLSFQCGVMPAATKAEKDDLAFWREHARILSSTLEAQNMSLFDEEAERVRAKMLAQIKKKLPELGVK